MSNAQGRARTAPEPVCTCRVVQAALACAVVLVALVVGSCADGAGVTTTSAVVISSTTAPAAPSGADVVDPAREEQARRFVTLLSQGKYADAAAVFSEQMGAALPVAGLEELWVSLLAQAGSFQSISGVVLKREQGYDVAYVTAEFENGPLDVKVVFDQAGHVAGLFFVPAGSGSSSGETGGLAYEDPAYVDRDAFTEGAVTVGAPGWPLPGTLSVPAGGGTYPGVVFVHGSGPNDRDETIGPNKPFKDLAGGLASRGVAVLRYDKRTFAHRDKLAAEVDDVTVEQDTVADAVAALARLRDRPEVDDSRVYLLGHSLGGYLAPQIAARDPEVAGVVLVAAPARPLEDLVLEQVTYLAELDGAVSAEEQQTLDELRRAVELVKDTALSPSTDTGLLPLGIPAKYWLDLRGYDPVATAAGLGVRFLVLQGARDYQTTVTDFDLWKSGLGRDPANSFVLYDDLNHLLMRGEGPSAPAEYEEPAHVDDQVLGELSGWIGG